MYEELLKFLRRYFNVEEIDGDTDIFQVGYVNSLFSQQLIMFLEKKFNINVEIVDMSIENFSTINNIMGFIRRKQNIQ